MDEKTQKLVNAAKVMLLDKYNRNYLRHNDPKAFEQLTAAVKGFERDIEEKIIEADEVELFRETVEAIQSYLRGG